jgi:hypothetical protein
MTATGSGRKFRMSIMTTATGRVKSSVRLAPSITAAGSRASASRKLTPPAAERSRARACASTIGSLST